MQPHTRVQRGPLKQDTGAAEKVTMFATLEGTGVTSLTGKPMSMFVENLEVTNNCCLSQLSAGSSSLTLMSFSVR